MAFDKIVIAEIAAVARARSIEPAALLAVAEIESGGRAFALVDGRYEPLIRFEGHYFDRRLTASQQKVARTAKLSSPVAGAIANPSTQAARWKMLTLATEINAQAAFESTSWGLGQVMGAHWAMLGFGSVTEMVNLARSGAAGQAELMARYIEKAGLVAALRRHDWAAFARGYNGPGYRDNKYDERIAAAFRKYQGGPPAAAGTDVRRLQELLSQAGFPVAVDGIRGPKTDAAVKAFQKSRGLTVDGIAGPATLAALESLTPPAQTPKPVAPQKTEASLTPARPAVSLWTLFLSLIATIFGKAKP